MNNGHPVLGQNNQRTVISVDAMGGDLGPAAVVAGLALCVKHDQSLFFILHGDEAQLRPLLAAHDALNSHYELRHAARIVTMDDKPSQVMRNGQGTSMWSAIEAVKQNEANVAVSCGNTGALMALSTIRLRRLPGVTRPAIACLWPSRNKGGFNIMLDVGADIRAEANDLLQYAAMGAAYARDGLNLPRPRVGLLNVGTEEHKGHHDIKQAHDLMQIQQTHHGYDFVGFVEGGDIPSNRVDVIVTDGFTGNIALKTGEGTAKLIGDLLKESLKSTFLSKIGALLALGGLKRLRHKIDPRRSNGGVFLGLNGTVVKSHGSSDATAISAAIQLAARLARSDFHKRLATHLASAHDIHQNTNNA